MVDWIRTNSRTRMSFTNPSPKAVSITDIAIALSRTCRFASQSPQFYSVAEHSVHVADWLGWPLAIYGLLHDAHESYTGDLPRPLKGLLGPEIIKIEDKLQGAIYDHCNLTPPSPQEWEEVMEIDRRILITELEQVMGDPVDDLKLRFYEALPIKILFLDPDSAKALFEQKFYSYLPNVNFIKGMWEVTK